MRQPFSYQLFKSNSNIEILSLPTALCSIKHPREHQLQSRAFSSIRIGSRIQIKSRYKSLTADQTINIQMMDKVDHSSLNSEMVTVNLGIDNTTLAEEPSEIRHEKKQFQDLARIEEEDNEGAHTQKPTSSQKKKNAADNPEDPDKREEEISKSMKKGLIIGGIALAVIVLGLTLVVAILTMSKFIATGGVEKSIPTTQGSIQTKNIQAIDSEVFNSKTPLTIYTSKVSQSSTPNSQNGRVLLEINSEYPIYAFRDQSTGITISVSSKDLQLRVSVDVPSVLGNVLNNQPHPEIIEDQINKRNLLGSSNSTPQQGHILYKQFTFFQVNNKIAEGVKNTCLIRDNNTKVSQQVSHDITYNKDIGSFELVPIAASPSVSVESVAFFDASSTPVIKNYNNENEVAAAVTTVIVGVIDKAKDFLQKRLNDLQKVSQVKLPQTDYSKGETSIYVDQPSDISKLCANINDSVLRCDSRALSSKVINLAPAKVTQTYDQIPTLVVIIDV